MNKWSQAKLLKGSALWNRDGIPLASIIQPRTYIMFLVTVGAYDYARIHH